MSALITTPKRAISPVFVENPNKNNTCYRNNSSTRTKIIKNAILDHTGTGKIMQRISKEQNTLGELKQFFESQDFGNVVHFEHVNLEVPDMEIARLFYAEDLGLTMDPGTLGKNRGGAQVFWFNIGRQQFHIAKSHIAQRINGRICLFVQNTDQIQDNLIYVQSLLQNTYFKFSKEDEGLISVTDPWGNEFSIMDKRIDPSQNEPCIDLIELYCSSSALNSIKNFYERYIEAQTFIEENELWVSLGSLTNLHFIGLQQNQQNGVQQVEYDGWHLALYVANLERVYKILETKQLIFNDHQYRDKCFSIDDLRKNYQLRVLDVVDEDGQKQFQLHHEVRGLGHPLIKRNLYNRWGTNFDVVQ